MLEALRRNDSSSKLSLNSSPDTKTTESLDTAVNKDNGSSLINTGKKETENLITEVLPSQVKVYIPLSQRLTGTYSSNLESYLRDLERQYGTMYMSEHVFGGDLNVYDPYKRASEITGIPIEKDGKTPVNCGSAGKEAFNSALYGEGSGDEIYNDKNTEQETNGIQLKYNESYEMYINKNAGDIKLTTTGGVGSYNGRAETYYSQRVLPGKGLQIPGRHVSPEDGTIRDADGYIVVAADLSIYPKGTVLECSLGSCKVYDTGVTGEHLDIYCDWMDGIEYSDMTQEQRESTVPSIKDWNAGVR